MPLHDLGYGVLVIRVQLVQLPNGDVKKVRSVAAALVDASGPDIPAQAVAMTITVTRGSRG
jgi:hypothetical protein